MTPQEAIEFVEQVRLQVTLPGHASDQFREAVEVLRECVAHQPEVGVRHDHNVPHLGKGERVSG